jgi:hypothetical protein
MGMDRKDNRTALRESMDQLDELMGFKSPLSFGKKTEPSDTEVEVAKDRRLAAATSRANDEKKSYGFLRSLKSKVFGKKEVEQEPEFKHEPRSFDDRLADLKNRANKGV